MKSLRLEFLTAEPAGPRKLREANWSGECVLCNRSRLSDALTTDHFDFSGVYLLVGIGEDGKYRVYIGQGDSVQERIAAHFNNKLFWETAIAFRRLNPELHAGNIKYLESRLIALAMGRGKCVVTNANAPQLPTLSPADQQETDEFFEHILFFLQALGFDFFAIEPPTPPEPPSMGDPMAVVPPKLRRVVEHVYPFLVAFPSAQFYATRTPDVRAKVTLGNDFRVFARIKFRKDGIRLRLKEVGEYPLPPGGTLDSNLQIKIKEAFEKAEMYLSAKAKLAAGIKGGGHVV